MFGCMPKIHASFLVSACASLAIALGSVSLPAWSDVPLRLVTPTVLQSADFADLGLDEQLWGVGGDRSSLVRAINYSLRYLDTPRAIAAYRQYPVRGITRDRVRRSLLRFRELLQTTESAEALRSAVLNEFAVYQSVGNDGLGTVDFTGYFEPSYAASRVPTAEFRYPLYRLPPNLSRWSSPHPTRAALEGVDGLQGTRGRLRGLELVWLRDRLEAYLIQVQGSARLSLTDGSTMTVGYAGRTNRSYVSIGRQLVNDGKLPEAGLTLPAVLAYFQQHPNELNEYLPRNNSFVFFRDTGGAPATGSLSVPVTAERSIATDKTLMPPGALALIRTQIPFPTSQGQLEAQEVSRFVLDQDRGGAIQGAGRVDIFVGTGPLAGDRAGLINNTGQLYYLLLNE